MLLQQDLAAVELLDAGAVADADDGGRCQLLMQQAEQRELALLVQRRGCLVHDDDLRLLDQQPGEGHALALAAGQGLVPAALDIELLDEIAQPATSHGLFHRGLRHGFRLGIGERLPQRSERQIGALRHEGDLQALRHADRARAPGPQPGERADQDALARAALAGEHHFLAHGDAHGGIVDDDAPCPVGHREALDMDGAIIAGAERDRRLVFHHGAEIDLFQRRHQLHHACCGCIPFRQLDEVVDEPDQRALHGAEGRHQLHDGAERQIAAEIFRRHQNERDQREQRPVAVEHQRDHALLADHLHPGGKDGAIASQHRAQFVLVATDQRHAFGILAQAGHLGAKLRFRLVLGRDARHQRAARDIGDSRRNDRIDDSGHCHEGRDLDGATGQRDLRAAADIPEDGRESRRHDDGAEQPERELDQRLDGEAHIIGNAKLGRRLVRRDKAQPVIALVGNPPARHVAREPGPPARLKDHARDQQRRNHQRNRNHQRGQPEKGRPDSICIAPLERVEEHPVPGVHRHLRGDLRQQACHHDGHQQPGAPGALAAPEPARDGEETPQHAFLSRTVRFAHGVRPAPDLRCVAGVTPPRPSRARLCSAPNGRVWRLTRRGSAPRPVRR